MNADCGRLHVETVVGIAEVDDAGEVRRDYVNRSAQHWNDRPTPQRGLCVSVQQDERWQWRSQVMQFDPSISAVREAMPVCV